MKALVALLLAFVSSLAFANGRCQGLVPNDRGCQIELSFVPVIMYHRFEADSAPSRENITPQAFEQQLQWLHRMGYATVTISQLVDSMEGRSELPAKAIAITIDDGWTTALDAAALLNKYGMSATFYVISGKFEHATYLNKQQVADLAANPRFEIGAHTHTHFLEWMEDLTKLDTHVAVGEMLMSKQLIEDTIKQPVRTFAWPFGYVRPEMLRFSGAIGFTSTVHVNADSVNTRGMSGLDVRRVNIDGRCTLEQFKYIVTTGRLERCDEKAVRVVEETVR